jgi:phospholipid/cholesterol/gamma-HCH transport system substrate-binding protein
MLVIIAIVVGGGLIARFGDVTSVWKPRYPLTVKLETASGLYPSAPVMLSGLVIGSVRKVGLNPNGGVNAVIDINENIQLPVDSRVVISRSLMGESAVEFVRGKEDEFLKPGGHVVGIPAVDPLVMIQRLEARTLETLAAFGDTSQEWQNVAVNLNRLMETERGNLDEVVENAAESLHQFTVTMKNANQMIATANKIVGDPASQQAMRDTLTSLPKLVNATKSTLEETRQAVASTRQTLDGVNRNLVNLSQVTEPLGRRGEHLVAKLDGSMTKLDQLLTELTLFAKNVNQKDGTVQKFVSDPALYEQLVRSSESVSVMLRNLEPVMRDLREFSDKIARHPEVLGLGGAVRPSTGLKDAELRPTTRQGNSKNPVARGNNPAGN